MATGATRYVREQFLDALFRGGSWPALPGNLYLSLHTADPGDAGANEVGASDYARLALPRTTADWTRSDDGLGMTWVENASDITFPSPVADWGTVTHVALWDAATGGTCLWTGALAAPVTLNAGSAGLQIPAGQLRLPVRGAG
ncbi:hypothetical protein OO015_13810 (plasmid) [Thermomicrobium sp. 4228-Ro]|uniref:phage tail fiber protein n=1 Tax=Thermomicrobium sp. 4228-Ro TaxID=2993937 RepID=UPI002248D1DC|nr:hypothetical protein [Thermomicrobium sp. 4228-Ro]MCX2728561.1 hypothetical protein [Thermomicrobium sp. 4228-Ro]